MEKLGLTSVLLICSLMSGRYVFYVQHLGFGLSNESAKGRPFRPPIILPQLCKYCDTEPSSCNGTGVCVSECRITSLCSEHEEVCASAWRRNEVNTTVETVCHNPALPFHGQYLTDYNNSVCLMKRVKGMEEDFYMCSCNAEECNDLLSFTLASPTPPEPSRALGSLQSQRSTGQRYALTFCWVLLFKSLSFFESV